MKGAYNFLKNNGVTISFALGAVLALIGIIAIVANFPEDATQQDLKEVHHTIFNPSLTITLALIIICSLMGVLGGVYGMIVNPKGAIRFGISAGILLVLFLITFYSGSEPSADMLSFYQGTDNLTMKPNTIASIDGLLLFTTVVIFLAIAAWVFSGVWGFIKQR